MTLDTLHNLLLLAKKAGAADVHMVVGSAPMMHMLENFMPVDGESMVTVESADQLAQVLLAPEDVTELHDRKEVVRAHTFPDGLRCRYRVSFQKAALSFSFHVLSEHIPTLSTLRLPDSLPRLIERSHGLVVVAGPYNSGRTSTAVALLQAINTTRATRILTIESPIEYILASERSLVEQREVGRDVPSYVEALREISNEDVGVVFIDHLDDASVMSAALELAASRLVITVIEASSAIRALEKMVGFVPTREAETLRGILAEVLLGVVAQRVVPRVDGGMAVIVEVLLATDPVAGVIREGRLEQLSTILQTSKAEGMISLDRSFAKAALLGEISDETALHHASEPEYMKRLLERRGQPE